MVSSDFKFRTSLQVVTPVLKGSDDGQHFPIPNLIITLCLIHGLGEIGYRVCYIPILNPNYAFPYLYSHLCNPLFDTYMHSLIFDFKIYSITVTFSSHSCDCDFSSCHQRLLVTSSFVCMHLLLFIVTRECYS